MADITERADPIVMGQRLAEYRKAAGLTQAEVADRLGISRPTFIALEKGSREAKAEEIIQLAGLYGRKLHDIVRPGSRAVALEPHLRANLNQSERDIDGITKTVEELNDLATDYRELERLLNSRLKIVHPPEVNLATRGDVNDLAETVALRERARLRLGDGPIYNLRNLLETNIGIRVFYGSMPTGISGMYAYVSDLGYCVMINRLHPKTRRRASLTHEWGHFLCDRHKPGIDLTEAPIRKPRNEAFCDAFSMSFLMPRGGITPFFHDVIETTNDFQVADLVRLSDYFQVSLEAGTRRLEALSLVPNGTWDMLKAHGFSPKKAKGMLGISDTSDSPPHLLPARYQQLAVRAFQQELITEGQLARFLRVDRLAAREIVEKESTRDLEEDRYPNQQQANLDLSLFPD